MALLWNCDNCAAPGVIHPRTEQMFKKETVTYEVPAPEPGNPLKKIKKEVERDVPLTTTLRRQNTQASRFETIEVPMTKDLDPRAILICLTFGNENIQKDFCMDCYNEEIKPHVEQLVNKLAEYQDK